MKDNFLLKKTQYEVFKELSNEDAGQLIKGIFKYVITGNSELDGYLKLIFIPIKTEIDNNESKYQETCKRNKENGKLGGRPKKEVEEENPKNPVGFEKTDGNPKNPIYHNHTHNHLSKKNLEDKGCGEKKPLDTDDTGLLGEISKKVIDYLNKKANTKYRYNSETTKTRINARMNEGYTLDDFITVIDKKYDEWIGTEMQSYIRPETLFGTKFESYLNQKTKSKKETMPEIFKNDIQENKATDEEIRALEERLKGR